ncbi:ECF transporter S component [Intestinibacillus massiliensis]|nr:ECF transporter S component [Intestinibacillus massiliensis]
MKNARKITLYDIIIVALMAAIVFAVTMFLSIRIPTPTGTTMIKLANAFCLLAGILFGGWRGGLAAGLGSMFFDFMTPEYIPEAWLTFIRFFLMAFVCGQVAHAGGALGKRHTRNLAAAIIASVVSTAFYIGKNVAVLLLAGSALTPALIAQAPKVATSAVNIVVAVVVAMALAPVLRRALDSIHFYDRFGLRA